jgi:hypothetical protein
MADFVLVHCAALCRTKSERNAEARTGTTGALSLTRRRARRYAVSLSFALLIVALAPMRADAQPLP